MWFPFYNLPLIKLFILYQCHQVSITSLHTADTGQLYKILAQVGTSKEFFHHQ